MAVTTVQANNKLIVYRKQITREYVRENLFSPYMGTAITSIIRVFHELKNGGEQVNLPLITKLTSSGVGAGGPLVGNEEAIDNYGFRGWIDWVRNAIKISNAEEQKSSVELFAEAKPLLTEWGQELQRDEICDALFALPSESAPAGLGSAAGQRVNGILFDAATATQRNTWTTDNADRIRFGDAFANLVAGNFASSTANITTAAAMRITAANLTAMKRSAKKASPKIRPYKTKNGAEWFVVFMGTELFRDCQADATILAANQNARAREGKSMMDNPIFVDGDLLYNGLILREVPELSTRQPTFYTTAGAGGVRISPAFLCGQSALAWLWGRMPTPTFLKEDDYQFFRGAGIKMAYGIAKIAKKTTGGLLKEWGVYTGFFYAPADT